MKTAARILGITGGAICLIYVIVSIAAGPEAAHMEPREFNWDRLIYAVFSVLGIAGGMLVNKRISLAGAFMLLSALLNINRSEGFLLTILGAVFALSLEDGEPQPEPGVKPLSNIKKVAKGLGTAGFITSIVVTALLIISLIIGGDPSFTLSGMENKLSLEHADPLAVVFFIGSVISIVCGILGSKLTGKKDTVAGVVMISGAVLSFPDILVSMFLLLGGIFALIPDKKPDILKEKAI